VEEHKHYVRLGLFVVGTLAVFVATLLLLGGRKWFQPTFTFETYFDQSVAGLELGAPVRFRGVPLGHVSEILTSAATYERDVPIERRREYIVVRVVVTASAREVAQMRNDAATLVRRGLRAQTQLAGVTGQQYLSLDFLDPRKYPPLQFPWAPRYPYLPSAPSLAGEIVAKAQTFLASLNEADIKSLGKNLNVLVADLDAKLAQLPLAELADQTRDVLHDAHATLGRVDRMLAQAPVEDTLRKLNSAAARLDGLLGDPALHETVENVAVASSSLRRVAEEGDIDRMVKGVGGAAERLDVILDDNQYDLRGIVQDLRSTSANLRELSETIKRYPAGALVAGPPRKIELPEASR